VNCSFKWAMGFGYYARCDRRGTGASVFMLTYMYCIYTYRAIINDLDDKKFMYFRNGYTHKHETTVKKLSNLCWQH
jgi:hypothetical protein